MSAIFRAQKMADILIWYWFNRYRVPQTFGKVNAANYRNNCLFNSMRVKNVRDFPSWNYCGHFFKNLFMITMMTLIRICKALDAIRWPWRSAMMCLYTHCLFKSLDVKKCPRNFRVKKWRTFSTGFILDRWDEIHTFLGSVRATLTLREPAPEASLHWFFVEKFGNKKCPRYSEPKKWRTFWSGIGLIDIGSLKLSVR